MTISKNIHLVLSYLIQKMEMKYLIQNGMPQKKNAKNLSTHHLNGYFQGRKQMPKFIITATETIFYWKEVEADSEEQVRDMVSSGEIDFAYTDVSDGDHFEICDIIEDK